MARPKRHFSVSLSSIPRNNLDSSRCGAIDALLKELKHGFRRLKIVVEIIRQEHKILQRLYYKGKNQHRSALFWKRIQEIRRYCDRLEDTNAISSIDNLWSSFFSEGSHQKGAWTLYPDAISLTTIIRRIFLTITFTSKMQDRLMATYYHLTLVMKQGTFLPLILTLSAIISRLASASSELAIVLNMISCTITAMSQKLHTEPSRKDSSELPTRSYSPKLISPCQTLAPVQPSPILVEQKIVDSGHRSHKVCSVATKNSALKDEIDEIFGC